MILIVASAHDPRARALVEHWGSGRALLLGAEDLSRPGWVCEIPPRSSGTCVADGRIVSQADITGILTLRPRLFPQELSHIAAADRDYVAAEMTAFLLAWLTTQNCPVLNAPSARSLAGPHWPAERWRYEAARVEIPLAQGEASPIALTVLGSHCFGAPSLLLASRAQTLARAAGTALLGCRFTPAGELIDATPWPSLSAVPIREALQARLEQGT